MEQEGRGGRAGRRAAGVKGGGGGWWESNFQPLDIIQQLVLIMLILVLMLVLIMLILTLLLPSFSSSPRLNQWQQNNIQHHLNNYVGQLNQQHNQQWQQNQKQLQLVNQGQQNNMPQKIEQQPLNNLGQLNHQQKQQWQQNQMQHLLHTPSYPTTATLWDTSRGWVVILLPLPMCSILL